MQNIEVTEEMRDRILSHLSAQPVDYPKKQNPFRKWKKMVPVAACIALLFVCGTFANNMLHPDLEHQGNNVTDGVADMVECKSAEELSQKAGFSVQDIEDIPFEVESTSYTWCWNEFAQVEYTGKENALLYRKCAGDEDISGDYTEYEQDTTEMVNGSTVTIKGNEDGWLLATWQSGGYSYSVSVSRGIPYDRMLKIIASIDS